MLMGLPDKSGEVAHSSESCENDWTCGMLQDACGDGEILNAIA